MTVGYDEDGERKSDVIDTEKYKIDPIGFTGGEGVSSNRLSNDMDLGSNSNVDVVDGSNTNDIIHVPKSNVRTRKDLTHKGWIKRRGGYGILDGCKRQQVCLHLIKLHENFYHSRLPRIWMQVHLENSADQETYFLPSTK